MKTLFAHVTLGALWVALTGSATAWNFVLGLALGYFALRATHGPARRAVYFRKIPEIFTFCAYFLRELVVSSLRVAHDAVTPNLHMRPAVIGVPIEATTDAEITLLACLISLTPGTLTLDVSEDRKTLFVHALFVHDYDQTRDQIRSGLERRVLRLMRS
ncbi:Na+/H+ antiporter subunit E [Myxococcota bacterium]|nr:Na+/H+ antiporter subunit E [Myxococcota bacterium]